MSSAVGWLQAVRRLLNVAIGYVDRATRRLADEPGYVRQARSLERLSAELAEVLSRLIAADQRHHNEEAS